MYTSMNYYMIPTKYMELPISYEVSNTEVLDPHTSCSYYRNIKSLKMQVDSFINHSKKEINEDMFTLVNRINNPYSFLSSVVSGDTLTTHSCEISSNENELFKLFFILIELCNTFDFLERELYQHPIHTIYVGKNGQYFQNGINFISNKVDTGIYTCLLDELVEKIKNNDSSLQVTNIKTIFFDIDIPANDYTYSNSMLNSLLKTLYIILNIRCTCIIKTGGFIFKPFIDILYILTGTYKTVYLSKPTVVQDINDRYVICKDSYTFSPGIEYITTTNEKLLDLIEKTNYPRTTLISTLLSTPISHHFITKIEESTLIIGQKNIENYENLILLIKMIGKDDKIESAKKSAIIKCIQWCTKYNISHTVGYV